MSSNLQKILALGLTFGLASCGKDDPARAQARLSTLIGGQQTSLYPSSVRFLNCTAAKVGPKIFLTAGHCMIADANGLPHHEVDSTHQLFVKGQARTVTLRAFRVHPSYMTGMQAALTGLASDYSVETVSRDSFDVSLVAIKEATPDIPEALIDTAPVKDGEILAIGGHGCQLPDFKGPISKKLKMSGTISLTEKALRESDAPGNELTSEWIRAKVHYYNIITSGKGRSSGHASICPGDSGGPVYRGNSQKLVVGVNAYYSFKKNVPVSRTNWHARLSNAQEWLSQSIKELTHEAP